MRFWRSRGQDDSEVGELDSALSEAVSALRDELPNETLSDAARSILFATVRDETGPGFRSRLRVGARWAIIGALPVVALVVLVSLAPRENRVAQARPLRLNAAKVGNEVIFTIQNGSTEHRVLKSSSPSGFNSASELPVIGGRFRDRADAGADIVFYRVD